MPFESIAKEYKKMGLSQEINIQKYLIRNFSHSFIMESVDDLPEDGILKGDFLIIDKREPCMIGDLVCIYWRDDLRIGRLSNKPRQVEGKVVGHFRKYY